MIGCTNCRDPFHLPSYMLFSLQWNFAVTDVKKDVFHFPNELFASPEQQILHPFYRITFLANIKFRSQEILLDLVESVSFLSHFERPEGSFLALEHQGFDVRSASDLPPLSLLCLV